MLFLDANAVVAGDIATSACWRGLVTLKCLSILLGQRRTFIYISPRTVQGILGNLLKQRVLKVSVRRRPRFTRCLSITSVRRVLDDHEMKRVNWHTLQANLNLTAEEILLPPAGVRLSLIP